MRPRPAHALRALPLAALLAIVALPAGSAAGSASQVTIMQDDRELVVSTTAHRAAVLDEMKALGADYVKFRLDWRSVAPAPNASTKPAGFSGEDSRQYPQAAWGLYDGLVKAIVARGMKPYVLLGGASPKWGGGKDGRGGTPNRTEFGRFVQAAGARYSGNFLLSPTDPLPLPAVHVFGIWQEPNLLGWISPQYKDGVPISARTYRRMLYAASEALAASGHSGSGEQMLIGELLPFARSGHTDNKVRPLKFLRELACLDDSYKPFTGNAAKKRSCPADFRPLPGTGLAHHPYTLSGGPDVGNPNKDDASIGELNRLVAALDKIGAKHRLVRQRMPIWVSELGFQTDPPDQFAAPIKRVSEYIGESDWLAFRNPRVVSYSQYPLIDDTLDGSAGGFQSGIRYSDGTKKPGVYNGFRLPLFVQRRSSNTVEIFGGVRAGAPGTQVTIQSKRGSGAWTAVKNGTLKLGTQGYFDRVFTLSNAADRQYRFRFSGGTSRVANVHS